MSSAAATPVDPLSIVTALIEMGHVDTVYRDVYLERARSVLGGVLSLDEFRFLEKARRDLAELSLSIARALERADRPLVKQLAARTQALRESVEGKQKLIETARDVYAVRDVSLDPFSPGLQTFTRVATSDLPALRDRTIKRLTALEEADAVEREFYAARRAALQELILDTAEATSAAPGATSAGDAREAASRALKAGDMKGLEKLAGEVMAAASSSADRPGAHASAPSAAAGPGRAPEHARADLLVSYSRDTVTRARQLGLAPRHLESRADLAALRRYALESAVLGRVRAHRDQGAITAAGTPEGFRDRLEMLVIHPLVNSGGRATCRHSWPRTFRSRLSRPRGRRGGPFIGAAHGPRASQAARALAHGHRARPAHARRRDPREGARPRSQGLPSGVHPFRRASPTWRGGGLGAAAIVDPLRWLPGDGRRASPGPRWRRRAVWRPLRPPGRGPGLRLGQAGGAVSGGAPRPYGRVVTVSPRSSTRHWRIR
jgi:hypothetical protein